MFKHIFLYDAAKVGSSRNRNKYSIDILEYRYIYESQRITVCAQTNDHLFQCNCGNKSPQNGTRRNRLSRTLYMNDTFIVKLQLNCFSKLDSIK